MPDHVHCDLVCVCFSTDELRRPHTLIQGTGHDNSLLLLVLTEHPEPRRLVRMNPA